MEEHFWMGCLDLRGVGTELNDVLPTPTRKVMESVARTRGFHRQDIHKAATRFNTFWIAGDWLDDHCFRAYGTTPGTSIVLTLKTGG